VADEDGDRHDDPGDDLRSGGLAHEFGCHSEGPPTWPGIGVDPGRLRPGVERRFDRAWLDQRDPDPERPDLIPEGFHQAFHGELAGAVVTPERHRRQPGHAADGDDVPGAAFAHSRQHGGGHPGHAEVVGLELRLGLSDRNLLDRSGAQVPGVVDQDIDSPRLAQDLTHAIPYRCVIPDVERDMLHRRATVRRSPAPAEHPEPGRGKLAGGGLANPRRRPSH
jgi:hypothetical protein